MTEADWWQCEDPRGLHRMVGERMSWRKRGLWLLACARDLWGRSLCEATQAGLALIEHLVETSPRGGVITALQVPAGQAVIDCGATEPIAPVMLEWHGKDGLTQRMNLPFDNPLAAILDELACQRQESWTCDWVVAHLTQAGLSLARQAELYRDIVRGPFRPLHFRAAWRTWQGGVPFQIAQEIYRERAFDQLPILADALEEAGCDEAEILDHCRSCPAELADHGGHVRGCWVVDLVCGRV